MHLERRWQKRRHCRRRSNDSNRLSSEASICTSTLCTTTSRRYHRINYSYQRQPRFLLLHLLFLQILLHLHLPFISCSSLPPYRQNAHNAPFHPHKIQSFLRTKTNTQSQSNTNNVAIWSYEGHLIDPNTNTIIANVEGMEIVRGLSECISPSTFKSRRKRRGASSRLKGIKNKIRSGNRATSTNKNGGKDIHDIGASETQTNESTSTSTSTSTPTSSETSLQTKLQSLSTKVTRYPKQLLQQRHQTMQRRKQELEQDEQKWNRFQTFCGFRRLGDLKIRQVLEQSNPCDWDYAGTLLSRKLFLYRPISSSSSAAVTSDVSDSVGGGSTISSSDTQILSTYRHTPTSPLRKIPIQQSVSLYDTATTFISRNRGKELILFSESPEGNWVQCNGRGNNLISGGRSSEDGSIDEDGGSISSRTRTTAGSAASANSRKDFDFTVYARRTIGKEPSVLESIATSSYKRGAKGKPPSPKRSKWIQFGKDTTVEAVRFGARETYSYTMEPIKNSFRITLPSRIYNSLANIGGAIGQWAGGMMDEYDSISFPGIFGSVYDNNGCDDCKMHYTRFGEAPPWYIPGRMCTLELWGRKVESVQDLPPCVANFAATRIPGFMAVHSPIPSGPSSYIEMMGTDMERSRDYDGNRGDDRSKTRDVHSTKLEKTYASLVKKPLSAIRRCTKPKGPLMNPQVIERQLASDMKAIQAVNWFRGKDSIPLVIDEDESDMDNQGFIPSIQSFAKKTLDEGLSLGQRICAATTMSSLDGPTSK